MANSGQLAGFYEENEGEMSFQSYQFTGMGCDPTDSINLSEFLDSPQNPTMGTLFNSQQCGQRAGSMHGIGFPDQININVQRTGTFDGQQHGQQQLIEVSHQNSFSGQPSSDINVGRTGTQKLTTRQAKNRSEINKEYRIRKMNERIEMANKLQKLEDKKEKFKRKITELKSANVSTRQNLQSITDVKDKLESDLEKLKQERDKQNAILLELLKDKDLKFIKEGDIHYMKPTQDPSPSDEERHSEKEISAGNLDDGDSEDDNDSKRKKKRAAHSGPSEHRFGKVSKFACYDARADQRQGSTSNPTAMVIDPYSMTECLGILTTMGDIPYPIVRKAIAILKSPVERETFVGLTEDWRKGWVKDLENDVSTNFSSYI